MSVCRAAAVPIKVWVRMRYDPAPQGKKEKKRTTNRHNLCEAGRKCAIDDNLVPSRGLIIRPDCRGADKVKIWCDYVVNDLEGLTPITLQMVP